MESQKKNKKKLLCEYNFYLKEASSSDSVDTESIVSYFDDNKLDESLINESDSEDGDDCYLLMDDDISKVDSLPAADRNNSPSGLCGEENSKSNDLNNETNNPEETDDCVSYNVEKKRTTVNKSDHIDTLHSKRSLDSSQLQRTQNQTDNNTVYEDEYADIEDSIEEEQVKRIKVDNNKKIEEEEDEDEENNQSGTQVFFGRTRASTVLLAVRKNDEEICEKNMSDNNNDKTKELQQHVYGVEATKPVTASNNCDARSRLSSVNSSSNVVTKNYEKEGDENKSSNGNNSSTTTNTRMNEDLNMKNTKAQLEAPILKALCVSATTSNLDHINRIRKKELIFGDSKKINETNRGDGFISPSSAVQYHVRADQFNKVCPSPFDEAPGFRRSFSIQHRPPKREKDLFSPKLSKSSSLDTAKMLQSSPAVVVGREKWIQFEEHHERKENDTMENRERHDSLGRRDWISFGGNETNLEKVSLEEKLDMDSITDDNEEDFTGEEDERFIPAEKSEKYTEGELRKDKSMLSAENLLDVVNKTVSLLKGSITKPYDDEKGLVDTIERDETSSEISDEVISLEFDTDEEKFRDTPVKQFPDISLFQVSTTQGSLTLDLNSKPNSQSLDIENDRNTESLDNYPPVVSRNSWTFWYRYPDRKKKLSSRKWLPVSVNVENGILKINGSSDNSDVVKEIPLHPFYVFTVPILHKGNKDGKVHSVKLQYVKYKEKLGGKGVHVHVPIYTPVVKLSSRNVISLRDFINRVETTIRHIPTYRDKGITYTQEAIFIDSEDECQYLISGEGSILKYNVTVRLRLRVFVTGNPELKIFLNDINNKEFLSRTKEALQHDNSKLSNNWISAELYEYHPCVDVNKSDEEGGVVFIPPDGCSFELLRFRVRKRNPLPLIATSSLEVLASNSVNLRADVRVNGDAKSIRHKRNNVILNIPIPKSWSKLFVKNNFGRTKTYLSVKSSIKMPQPAKASNSRVTLNISTGSATYEPAYGSIVWKLGSLPIIRDGMPADATHTFQCFLELPFPLQIRDDFQPYSYLEYNVVRQIGSEVLVEEILLSNGRVPYKLIIYRSRYMHKIEMKVLEDGKIRKCSN